MRTVLRLLWMSLVLLTVALLSALVSMRLAIHGREVAVPSVLGKTAAEARHIADDSGLAAQVEREYYSQTVPEGRVISQVPAAGTVVRRGWQVRLAVSIGPQRVSIPQVVGESDRAAAIVIAQRGLQLGVPAAVAMPGATAGLVLAQNPPANATDVSAPKISLLVAADNPPEVYVMPSFIGQPLGSVSLALKDAGFSVGKVSMQAAPPPVNPPDATQPAAPSNGTSPQPGGQSPIPSPVPSSSTTSSPVTPPATPPPPQPTANAVAPPSPASIVVSQDPAPGQRILAGSAINFVVR